MSIDMYLPGFGFDGGRAIRLYRINTLDFVLKSPKSTQAGRPEAPQAPTSEKRNPVNINN